MENNKAEMEYKCEHCGEYVDLITLRKHLGIKMEEGEEVKLEKCDDIEEQFGHSSNLRRDLIDTEKVFHECKYCNKVFKRKNILRIHLRIHERKPVYECENCGKKFENNSSLDSHLNVHRGETPYECEHCEKKFKSKSYLKIHLRSHTGERPQRSHTEMILYECKLCENTFFKSNINLKLHLKTHDAGETI